MGTVDWQKFDWDDPDPTAALQGQGGNIQRRDQKVGASSSSWQNSKKSQQRNCSAHESASEHSFPWESTRYVAKDGFHVARWPTPCSGSIGKLKPGHAAPSDGTSWPHIRRLSGIQTDRCANNRGFEGDQRRPRHPAVAQKERNNNLQQVVPSHCHNTSHDGRDPGAAAGLPRPPHLRGFPKEIFRLPLQSAALTISGNTRGGNEEAISSATT